MAGSYPFRWAGQVITFYHPRFWGVSDDAGVHDLAGAHPATFFDRLLDSIQESGVEYVEFCIPPGDWKTALNAYGSAAGVAAAIASRGLRLDGSYQSGWALEAAMNDHTERRRILDDVRAHAAFVVACGADILMTGPPRRGSMDGAISRPVSDRSMELTAGIVSEMAEACRTEGVRLAVHTEAYSVVCRPEEITRLMESTEPGLVNLCPDVAHIALDGGDPAAVIVQHGERVTNMHWKDCIGQRIDLPAEGVATHEQMMEQFRKMGDGTIDWVAVVAAARDAGFDGFVAAEIDLAPEPIASTRDIVTYYDEHLASIYGGSND